MARHRTGALLLAAALTLLGSACAAPQRPGSLVGPEPDLGAIDSYVERALGDWHVPGLGLAIVHDGEVVHARGFGVREHGKADPVDADTIFQIASMTKPFTAAAVGLLVSEGRLGWDDRVVDRLPGFQMHDPTATADMRVRDLLSHRSGLDTFAGDLVWTNAALSREEVLRRLHLIEPASGLRYRYGYANLMFLAAGELIEAVSGQTWEDVVRGRFLQPLGMTRTTMTASELATMTNVATPHMEVDGALRTLPRFSMDSAGPAGSMASCARDMALWARAQLEGGTVDGTVLIPAQVIAETRAPHTAIPLSEAQRRWVPQRHLQSYGLGWFLFDYRGRLVVAHDGGLPGTFSVTMLVPEERLGVVVLTNAEQMLTRAIAYRVIDAFVGAPETDWSADFLRLMREPETEPEQAPDARQGSPTGPELPLAAYVGDYSNPLIGPALVREQEGSLVLAVTEHEGLAGPLVPRSGSRFECRWNDPIFDRSEIVFDVEDSRPVRLRFAVRPDFIDPVEYAFERVEAVRGQGSLDATPRPGQGALSQADAVALVQSLSEVTALGSDALRVVPLDDLADIGPSGACTGAAHECLRWVRVERVERGQPRPWHDFGVDPTNGRTCVGTAPHYSPDGRGACLDIDQWRQRGAP